MPKTFPIIIDVEEIALGTVLRKLNDMAGIAKLHLDLGRGGEKGQEALAKEAVPLRQRGASAQAAVLKLLAEGPKHIREISRALGGGRTRAYATMNGLRKRGLSEAGDAAAVHQLTAKGRALLKGTAPPKALPTPDGAHRVARGRSLKGVSEGFLLAAIAGSDGPRMPRDLAPELAPHGFSAKAVESAVRRAKDRGLIRNTGKGYELTTKGLKLATPAASAASAGMNGTGAASHG